MSELNISDTHTHTCICVGLFCTPFDLIDGIWVKQANGRRKNTENTLLCYALHTHKIVCKVILFKFSWVFCVRFFLPLLCYPPPPEDFTGFIIKYAHWIAKFLFIPLNGVAYEPPPLCNISIGDIFIVISLFLCTIFFFFFWSVKLSAITRYIITK